MAKVGTHSDRGSSLSIQGIAGAADDDVVMEITDVERFNEFSLMSDAGAMDVDVSFDGINFTAGLAATGVLTASSNVVNNDTVTIDGKVYTFQTVLTNVDGNVNIGALATDSLDNLIDAINLGAGAGTDYAAATTLHPSVSALAGVGDTIDATAKVKGTNGNDIDTTEVSATLAWGNTTLTGGTEDPIALEDKHSVAPATRVVVTAASRLYHFFGNFKVVRVRQNGSTAVTNARMVCRNTGR